eukprot:RCo002442
MTFGRLLFAAGLVLAFSALRGLALTTGAVTALTEPEFAAHIFTSKHVSAVFFAKPRDKDIAGLKTAFDEAAEKLAGAIEFGLVNATEPEALELLKTLNVKDTPAVGTFPPSMYLKVKSTEHAPLLYKGPANASAIVRWIEGQIPGELVTVARTEFEMNQFLELNSEFPRAVLFNNKSHTSAIFKALSVELADQMVFCDVRAIELDALNAKYGVKVFSTLMVFTPGTTIPKLYTGANVVADIVAWLKPLALPESAHRQALFKRQQAALEAEQAALLRKTNPTGRVTNQSDWADLVLNRDGISAVAFLDPTSPTHKDNLRLLSQLHRKASRIGLVWVDITQQPELAAALQAGPPPTVVFVHPTKKWFKPSPEAFTLDSLKEYIRTQLLSGAGQPFNASSLPTLKEELNKDVQELDPDEERALKEKEKKLRGELKKRYGNLRVRTENQLEQLKRKACTSARKKSDASAEEGNCRFEEVHEQNGNGNGHKKRSHRKRRDQKNGDDDDSGGDDGNDDDHNAHKEHNHKKYLKKRNARDDLYSDDDSGLKERSNKKHPEQEENDDDDDDDDDD